MATTDRWRIEQEPTGWSVYRNRRVAMFDFDDVSDAMAWIRRKVGRGVEVKVRDTAGETSTLKT